MSARSKARKRALDVIFAAEARGGDLRDTLAGTLREVLDTAAADGAAVNPYTVALVEGVRDHLPRLDELIGTYAEGWSLQRMPAVDRNVLRLGVHEVLFGDDVPDAVAVSEAVNLARDLSTDESPAFVNGVLAHVVRDKAVLAG